MSQQYQKELDFVVSVFKKLRIPVRFVHPGDSLQSIDDGIRQLLGMESDYEDVYGVVSHWSKVQTIYKVVDQFLCHYVYFQLPMEARFTSVVIGPYLTDNLKQQTIQELAEQMKLPMHAIPYLTSYYMVLPVYQDVSAIMAMISTLGEIMWGDGDFSVIDVNYEQRLGLSNGVGENLLIEQENILQQMEQMETRYAYENEVMEIVSKGQTSRADVIMENISVLNYQQRHADPLRNMRNYCIICNTLLRKAAQKGGVHPLHLDRISGRFAQVIENTPTQEKCAALIGEMVRAYCHLVKTNSGNHYSDVIQKTLVYIDANLSGDLSLTTLAGQMQVTPTYLSSLFHRETGRTLADHITDLRMKAALPLLKNTRLQVQSVAQLCGFSDPNYFGKQFKRFYGVTALQYRKSQISIKKREE